MSLPLEVSLNLLHREQLPPAPPLTTEKWPLNRSICGIYLISNSFFLQKSATALASSSSLESFITQFILTGRSPALFAASIPSNTSFISPVRVTILNFSGLIVSRLIFTLCRPASLSSLANCFSRVPFVVIDRSSIPFIFEIILTSVVTPFLTSGSPPVNLTFVTPFDTATSVNPAISSNESILSCRNS